MASYEDQCWSTDSSSWVAGVALDTAYLIAAEVCGLIILSKLFHLVLRRYHLPTAASQILAGLVIGSSGLRQLIIRTDAGTVMDMFNGIMDFIRPCYMFLVGLEMDRAYQLRTYRRSMIVAYVGMATCMALACAGAQLLYTSMTHSTVERPGFFGAVLMVTMSDVSSPVLAHIISDMKLKASGIGRLAISAAVANDMTCIVGTSLLSITQMSREETPGYNSRTMIAYGGEVLTAVVAVLVVQRPVVYFVNWCNKGQRHVRWHELLLMLGVLLLLIGFAEAGGYKSLVTGLLLGLTFPREGPAARTLVDSLSYPMHAMLMPLLIGLSGIRVDFSAMGSGTIVLPAMLLSAASLLGKVVGALTASSYLKIPFRDGLILGFLMNIKGHVDIITMQLAANEGIWAEQALYALLISSMISTLVAAPMVTMLARKERNAYACSPQTLQSVALDQELRVLACVHRARNVPALLSLTELLTGPPLTLPAVHVLHLIDPTDEHVIAKKLYDPRSYEIDEVVHGYGGNAVAQVNAVVDVFAWETGISFRQIDIDPAHKDVRILAEDVRASLLLLPYHKEQHHDGKMICRKDGRRELNLKVLEHAPCTIGILVDRPFGGGIGFQTPSGLRFGSSSAQGGRCSTQVLHRVVAVFLGGPDDREAIAFACRLAMHPVVSVTVVRFVQPNACSAPEDHVMMSSASINSEVAMIVREDEAGQQEDADEAFMSHFCARFAAKEIGTYVEKKVDDAAGIVAELSSMVGVYSLFIVGKGRQPAEMTAGLGASSECAEIGSIGNLLARHEDMEMGSVLVIQQHTVSHPQEGGARKSENI